MVSRPCLFFLHGRIRDKTGDVRSALDATRERSLATTASSVAQPRFRKSCPAGTPFFAPAETQKEKSGPHQKDFADRLIAGSYCYAQLRIGAHGHHAAKVIRLSTHSSAEVKRLERAN
jgi:hypothetical protein